VREASHLRTAVLSDLVGVSALDHAAFGNQAYSRIVLRQFYDLAGAFFVVTPSACDALSGYALASPAVTAGEIWLLAMAVRSKDRGRGLGRALAVAVLERARAASVVTVRLTVHPDNQSAIRLYTSLAFCLQGRDETYFGPGEPRLVMARDL
jgi:ribosomal-protein-alanine N-acetyltransferase